MTEKSPLELLKEVKEALDFQLVVLNATEANSISLNKDRAYICLIAVEKLISKLEGSENET